MGMSVDADRDYSCGAAFCDDPVCNLHGAKNSDGDLLYWADFLNIGDKEFITWISNDLINCERDGAMMPRIDMEPLKSIHQKAEADNRNRLENYLKGEPLNEALAALMDGNDGEPDPAATVGAHIQYNYEGLAKIDDDDREHLRRLTLEPGWPVLLRLLDRDIEKSEDAMKATSMVDSLNNRDRIANGWADVAKMKAMRTRLNTLIENEIRTLREAKR